MSDIATWLENLGLGKYQAVLAKNDVDFEVLPELTEQDLERLGLSLGHRKKLLKAIAALSADYGEAEDVTAPPVKSAPSSTPMKSRPERRQLTVMFVDLVGSTALSGQLDPEEMREVIFGYQNTVAGEIARFEGHVAKYMGDGVLAYFGWPRAHEDEAERAVRAALAVNKAVATLSVPDGTALAARIGIATGLVVVGDLVGEGAAQEEAVIGGAPNLAARLQMSAGPGAVVISDATHRLLGKVFELQALAPQDFKGIAAPVNAWKVIGFSKTVSRFEAMRARGITPLIGREHELSLLLERWALCRDGEGQVVLLSGEPGIGKSRLIQAMLTQITSAPPIRLRYYCSPYHTSSALYPVVEQLERAAGITSNDDADSKRDKLEGLLAQSGAQPAESAALLAALLSIPGEGRYPALALTPQAQKAKTFEVLLAQLEGLAAVQPVLMIFEDAHWIDPTSVELLEQVIDLITPLPVLLMIAFRPEFTSPWGGRSHVTSLALNRLGQRHGGAMIERLTRGKALPDEVVNQILDKTDGVPLFVEELTRNVLESGLLRETDSAFVLDAPLPSLAIPATLHDSLTARLDRLAPVKELAQIGAVIGREFSYELLAAVAPMPEDGFAEALDQLVASELIFRRGSAPRTTYIFKHALVQDAAYQGLLKSRRQQLHARIAQVLETDYSQRAETEPELLAHHYTAAGLAEQAVVYWVRAAQRATNRSANHEVVSHVKKGMELLANAAAGIEKERQQLELQYALGIAYRDLKGFNAPETKQAFLDAQLLCERVGDNPIRLISILRSVFNHHFTRGEHLKCQEIVDQIAKLAMQTRKTGHSMSETVTGANLFHRGKLQEADKAFRKALSGYEGEQQDEQIVYVLNPKTAALMNRSWTLWTLGYPDQAVRTGDEAIQYSRKLAQPFALTTALVWVASVRACCGHIDAVETLVRELKDIMATHHITNWEHRASFLEGRLQIAKNHPSSGINLIRQALDTSRAAQARLVWTWMASEAATAYRDAGEIDEGIKLLAEAFELVETNHERFWESELYRQKGELLLSQTTPDLIEAEACFRQALEISKCQSAKSLELRAASSLTRLWRRHDKRRETYDLLAPVYAWFAEGFDTADLKDAKALLNELA